MATRETISGDTSSPFAGPFEPARIELAWEASSEVEAIAHMMRREAKRATFNDSGFEAILRTSLKRIIDLSGVSVSVLSLDDEPTAVLREVVFHEATEVQHV